MSTYQNSAAVVKNTQFEPIHNSVNVFTLLKDNEYVSGDACPTLSNEIKGKSVCICCLNTPKRKVKEVPKRIIYYEIPKPKFSGESVTVRDYKTWPIERRKPPAWHPKNSQPWKQLTVPCATETTYNLTFRPHPPRRLLSKRSQMDRE
ncbi:uncharacterized protein CEXT_530561 [Caerostris extrusa]|uniref:Uncharacterized protein n=1 Tax=Caerostris extrusa TaxID=172846 RepID=A0AAV4T810_CAEEX|nr:uncharacterized protein CEXT_530561 [Caerostris extrusa]